MTSASILREHLHYHLSSHSLNNRSFDLAKLIREESSVGWCQSVMAEAEHHSQQLYSQHAIPAETPQSSPGSLWKVIQNDRGQQYALYSLGSSKQQQQQQQQLFLLALYQKDQSQSQASTTKSDQQTLKRWEVGSSNDGSITFATMSLEDDTLNVWVAYQEGIVRHYFIDLGRLSPPVGAGGGGGEVELVASVQVVEGCVDVIEPVPWTPLSPFFYCWIATKETLTLYGYSANQREMRALLTFLIPSHSVKAIRLEIVRDSLSAEGSCLFAYYQSRLQDRSSLTVIAVHHTIALIHAERIALHNLPSQQLPAPILFDRILGGQKVGMKGLLFRNEGEVAVYAMAVPHSVQLPLTLSTRQQQQQQVLPWAVDVIVVSEKATLHLIECSNVAAQTVLALKQRVQFHDMNFASQLLTLENRSDYQSFDSSGRVVVKKEGMDGGGAGGGGGQEEVMHCPLWQACLTNGVALPTRLPALRALSNQVDLTRRVDLQRIIVLEGLLAIGHVAKIAHALRPRRDESSNNNNIFEEDIQGLVDWIASSSGGGGGGGGSGNNMLPSLLYSLNSQFTSVLREAVIPHLLSRDGRRPQPHAIPPPPPPATTTTTTTTTIGLLETIQQLNELNLLIHAVYLLTQGLFDRKLFSLLSSTVTSTGSNKKASWDVQAFTTIKLDRSPLSRSMVEFFFLHEEYRLLRCLYQFLRVLCEQVYLGCTAFLPPPPPPPPTPLSSLPPHQREEEDHHHCLLTIALNQLAEETSFSTILPPSLVSSSSPLIADLLREQLPLVLQDRVNSQWEGFSQNPIATLEAVLTLPYLTLCLTRKDCMETMGYVGQNLQSLRQKLGQVLFASRQMMLYLLFTNYQLVESCLPSHQHQQLIVCNFFSLFATALQCLPREISLIWALQRIDNGDCKEDCRLAVDILCRSDYLEVINQWKWTVIPAVAWRLLHAEALEDCHAFMSFLAASKHPFLSTRQGIVAYAAALPDKDEWLPIWLRTRLFINELNDHQEGLTARLEATQFMILWALRNQVLSQFLQQDFHPLEIEVIVGFLKGRAEADGLQGIAPSPAVDTLVSFLLQQHRLEEAFEAHENHVKQVREAGGMANDEVLRSFEDRKLLLDVHHSLPSLPELDCKLIRHLYEQE